MEAKYGGWGGLRDGCNGRGESIWWRDLEISCGSNREDKWFDHCMRWKLGDGERTSFWHDNYLSGDTLALLFPRLFMVSL